MNEWRGWRLVYFFLPDALLAFGDAFGAGSAAAFLASTFGDGGVTGAAALAGAASIFIHSIYGFIHTYDSDV
jgi:hypothetical protein